MPEQITELEEIEMEGELELQKISRESERTKKIAVVAIFAALSIAIAPVASFLPRLNWGIALFDPVSLVWIAAFLIGGPYVGIATSLVGTIGLGFYDPTMVGPMFKLLATLPMILVPSVYASMKTSERRGETLGKSKTYAWLMLVAFIIRLLVMIPTNIILTPILFGIDDVGFILNYTILLNAVQSLWDAMVPYATVHLTPLYKDLGIW